MKESLIVVLFTGMLLIGGFNLSYLRSSPVPEVSHASTIHWPDAEWGYSIMGKEDDEPTSSKTSTRISQVAAFQPKSFRQDYSVNDWHGAHLEVQSYLEKNKNESYFYISAQKFSCLMLDKYLLKQPAMTPDIQQAIAYYMGLLGQYKNNEYKIISLGLEKLEGYWTAEQVRQVAAQYVPLVERSITQSIITVKHCDSIANARQLSRNEGRSRRLSLRSIEANMQALATMRKLSR